MKRTMFAALCVLLSIAAVFGNQDDEWLWIHGQLEDESDQEDYLEFATQMFGYYQDRGSMTGRLVAEDELEAWPEERIVIVGPIEAFEDPSRFGLPLEVKDGEVSIGGQTLTQRRTGIYLAGENKTRFAYTGLSLDGFRDVFTVPTGDVACTVTHGRGKVLFKGDYGANGLVLEGLPFLDRYPAEGDLRGLTIPEGALVLKPVFTEPELDALEPEFTAWLDGFVKDQRVLFFGESHWSAGVNLLFHRIVEHLLETGRLRTVFLEVNYSFSGFYDHYITEPDEDRALEFLETRLHPLVASSSGLELLELLRGWNLDHPDQLVHVGCLDMEWSSSNVVEKIIQPYFRRLDDEFTLRLGGETPRDRVQELLDEAREQELVGEYPFLTAEYLDQVIANLWDTLDIEDFNVDRQRGILRNLTEFNGPLLEEGLVLFKGGGWHALKHKPNGETFYREAAYLNEVHPSTKGKVVTLYAQGLGYRFDEIADLNLRRRMSSATNYNDFLREFQKALADGRAERDVYYLLDRGSLTLFDRLAIKAGYESKRDYLRLDSADWEKLSAVHGPAALQGRARDYDSVVYVLRSGIEVMRPRIFETR